METTKTVTAQVEKANAEVLLTIDKNINFATRSRDKAMAELTGNVLGRFAWVAETMYKCAFALEFWVKVRYAMTNEQNPHTPIQVLTHYRRELQKELLNFNFTPNSSSMMHNVARTMEGACTAELYKELGDMLDEYGS